MRFGLDFGTSNSTLAVSDGGAVTVLALDPLAGAVMPSVLYVRNERRAPESARGPGRSDTSVFVGRAAIDAYLADNVARGPIRREFKLLDVRMASSDPEQPTVQAHIYTDLHAPGRLFQALKSFLGDPLLQPTNVFGTARGLSELIALLFVAVRERAAALTGVRPSAITLGRPVRFVGGEAGEARAVARLREAAELAGFGEVAFVYEPVAAAHAAAVPEGTTLVFDFGGGTLDLCLVRREGARLRVLATAGRDIGGDRCTELLIDDVVAPRLGADAIWGPKRLRLPAYIANAIRDWHALSALNEKPLLDTLDDLVRMGAPRRELDSLRSAIELQLGYEIFATVDRAKCELSDRIATLLIYHRAAVDVDVRFTRLRFERLIAPLLRAADDGLAQVLRAAGVDASDVVEVVCTGGSSAIPAARALLARRFPRARVRDADPYTSVAAGLALPDVVPAALG